MKIILFKLVFMNTITAFNSCLSVLKEKLKKKMEVDAHQSHK